jgi:hypothetical protein
MKTRPMTGRIGWARLQVLVLISLVVVPCYAAEFIPWSTLRNPVFQHPSWSVKDATMLYRGGEFFLVFNAYYEENGRECCHLVGVTTKDFRTFSKPRFNRSGADRGWMGIAAPNLTETDGVVCLTYNSWGDKPGVPNQLFYATSTNLTDWVWDLPLATNATRDAAGPVRAIDAAITPHGRRTYLVWKESTPGQSPQMAVANQLGAGRWTRLGRPSDIWFENGQFLRIDGRWHLLVTGPGHLPHLAAMRGSGDSDTDWINWEQFRVLNIPRQQFNTMDRANAAFLADWRTHDGFYYLIYAGNTEKQTHAGRGDNTLGLARSRDLSTWETPPAAISE